MIIMQVKAVLVLTSKYDFAYYENLRGLDISRYFSLVDPGKPDIGVSTTPPPSPLTSFLAKVGLPEK